jgi:hypothetical protein
MISSFSRQGSRRRIEEPRRPPGTQRRQSAREFEPIPKLDKVLTKKIIWAAIEVHRSLNCFVSLVSIVVGKMQRKRNPVT